MVADSAVLSGQAASLMGQLQGNILLIQSAVPKEGSYIDPLALAPPWKQAAGCPAALGTRGKFLVFAQSLETWFRVSDQSISGRYLKPVFSRNRTLGWTWLEKGGRKSRTLVI
jgi:hypothetical protein